MSLAVQIARQGGIEEMKLVDVAVGEPGPGEVRIRHRAIGLNFIDVYQRSGVYPLPTPLTLGMEGAGVIEAVGAGVTHLAPGDRARPARNGLTRVGATPARRRHRGASDVSRRPLSPSRRVRRVPTDAAGGPRRSVDAPRRSGGMRGRTRARRRC